MSTLSELQTRTDNRRRVLDALSGEARSVLTRGKNLQTEISELTQAVSTLEKTSLLLNSLGEERQFKAQTVIEELVTRGLQQIFDETLSFHIIASTKAKAASIEFLVRTSLPGGTVVDTPVMDARGGGLAATIGFLLRVVIMLLRGGARQDNILVLDETFAHVSDDYLDGVGEFLRELVDRTGIQIVMVTHQNQFLEFADKVYRFTAVDGKTQVVSA